MATPTSTIAGNCTFRDGTVTFTGSVKYPKQSIGDAEIDPTRPITAEKLEQRVRARYAQPNGSAATNAQEVVHAAAGATGTVLAFRAGVRTAAAGAATVTIDLKKNGTSILTSVISIDNTVAAFAMVDSAIATDSYVADDIFEIVVTATAGGGTLPQGLFVDFQASEDPA